jgi:predicted ATP-dependent Lon-type protease
MLVSRDRKAVKKTISGLMKIIHPHGQATKDELAEILEFAMEGRRRVKEQSIIIRPSATPTPKLGRSASSAYPSRAGAT